MYVCVCIHILTLGTCHYGFPLIVDSSRSLMSHKVCMVRWSHIHTYVWGCKPFKLLFYKDSRRVSEKMLRNSMPNSFRFTFTICECVDINSPPHGVYVAVAHRVWLECSCMGYVSYVSWWMNCSYINVAKCTVILSATKWQHIRITIMQFSYVLM